MTNERERLREALAGAYAIERELGSGGMATVYLAEDLKHHRHVALKVFKSELAAVLGPDRFVREIEIAAGMHHPHVLPLYDSGEAGGFLFYTMPYVDGESLRDRLDREGQLPIDDALHIAREVADALSYAHSRAVVHRDIKPENILLAGDHALVTDFGIARAIRAAGGERLTQTGMVVGTPAYMSPEQASAEGALDARTDIYALGCVLYEMLAGAPPFTAANPQAVIARHVVDPVPSLRTVRSAVPPALERIVMTALAKMPADRFRDMSAVLRELQLAAVSAVSPDATPAPSPHESVPSIAVLPFSNMSADPEQEYFCDGMAEEITNALVRAGGLRVAARTSAFAFKGSNASPRDIGRRLRVQMLLEGSVRKAGHKLRITARLSRVREGFHVWSERYDREMEDVFAIQDDIAQAIMRALEVELGKLGGRPTANLDAYDAYLRGLYAFNKRSRTDNDKAVELLERATALDPEFALAHAALAKAYLENFFTHDPQDSWEEKAFVALEKARALDTGLAEVCVARGNLLWTRRHGFPHAEAIAQYRRAIEINPNLPDGYNELARVYWHIGMLDEASAMLYRAMEIDPAFIDGVFRLAWLEMHRGNYAQALSFFRRVPEGSLAPSVDALTARALLCMGKKDEGIAQLARIDGRYAEEPDLTSMQAIFLAASGEAEQAEAKIERAIAAGRHFGHFHHISYSVAVAYALMDQNDRAMEWLEFTANDGFPCYPWFKRDPCLGGLRRDARFAALVAELEQRWSPSALA